MHWGFRIVEDMIDGLKNWMDEKGFTTIEDFRGASLPHVKDWKNLNLNYKIVAKIHPEKCIGCDLCYIACWDGAHQCIHIDGHPNPESLVEASRRSIAVTPIPKLDGAHGETSGGETPGANGKHATPPRRIPHVDEHECVGCNLCWLVCPVEDCITMERVDRGVPAESWEQRTGASR
jgi:dihydropyrimidine dehydrogenase (NAD+) subunit PreA